MLSMNSEFSVLDIDSIEHLKRGAVYLVKGNGPAIVVKREEIHGNESQHFDLNRKAMGVIDKDVKASHRLSVRELAALTSFIAHERHRISLELNGRLPGGTADLDTALNVLNGKNGATGAGMVWYKMPLMSKMDNLQDAWNKAQGARPFGEGTEDQSSALMSTFLTTLKAPGGLEALGQVIAADLFNGSRDRIAPKKDKMDFNRVVYGNKKYVLHTIKNVGNLMIVNNGKAATITGMDFIDPKTIYTSVTRSLDDLHKSVSWDGYVIVDQKQRKEFAKAVVQDLEEIFKAGSWKKKKDFFGRTLSDQSVLGSDAARRLSHGMVKGAKLLVKYFDERRGTKTYPPSILERVAKYRTI